MALILKIDPVHPEAELISKAAAVLKDGGVIAYPTETFYGLGVDATSEKAVERVFAVKGRDFKNPIPVIVGDVAHLEQTVTDIPPLARELIACYWPGPLTLVFAVAPVIPNRLTAETGKIGVRISSHPIARLLAERLGGPLTST
ncbi:MAG: threonylcarbamoyl-AMP synthase, partial [Syntrophaceae bacterium]|nr:threonylcarbamoyl-AMP synthase [Syntrophaceae bacterium]